MKVFVRRSHLLVPVLDREKVETSWTHNADSVILDLTGIESEDDRSRARSLVKESVRHACRGGADVFVLPNKALARADIEASVCPGLKGIVYPGAETSADIEEADSILSELETGRGIASGVLQIIALIDSGTGVWNIREIVTASPRVCSSGLDELNLCRNMGIIPYADFDPFVYAKGRIVVETRAAKVQPIGISHPYGVLPQFDDADEIYQQALRGKNLGFAGAICPDPSWVVQCNTAFAPPADRLEFFRETRRLFAEGVARGTAAVPYPGTTMMIDVPVDENARVNLELWELCAAREAEKAKAIEKQESTMA